MRSLPGYWACPSVPDERAAAVCLITKTEAFVPDDGRADYNGTTTATATPDTRRLSYNGRLDGTYMIDGGTFQLP